MEILIKEVKENGDLDGLLLTGNRYGNGDLDGLLLTCNIYIYIYIEMVTLMVCY
jgi:hypothetical protein